MSKCLMCKIEIPAGAYCQECLEKKQNKPKPFSLSSFLGNKNKPVSESQTEQLAEVQPAGEQPAQNSLSQPETAAQSTQQPINGRNHPAYPAYPANNSFQSQSTADSYAQQEFASPENPSAYPQNAYQQPFAGNHQSSAQPEEWQQPQNDYQANTSFQQPQATQPPQFSPPPENNLTDNTSDLQELQPLSQQAIPQQKSFEDELKEIELQQTPKGFSLQDTLNMKPQTGFSSSVLREGTSERILKLRDEAKEQKQSNILGSSSDAFRSKVTGLGDKEIETAVLASLRQNFDLLRTLRSEGFGEDFFSTHLFRAMFKAIVMLRKETKQPSSLDKVVLKNILKRAELLNNDSIELIEEITNADPIPSSEIGAYVNILKKQALKRKLKEISNRIDNYIEDPKASSETPINLFAGEILRSVRDVQKAQESKRINLIREELFEIIDDVTEREERGEIEILGYSFSPMDYLNKALSGFRKGFMYAIAGAPRRGKTTFTLEMATRVATLNKIPVLFFTYEQTKKNLAYRILAKESRLNPGFLQRKKIRSNYVVDAKFQSGLSKIQEYMDYFYIIEATKEDTVDKIRSYAYNTMEDFGTEDIMIFVDYIQKMPLSRNYMDEKFKIEEISTELKALCIELNNPIMAISSLSKEGCQIDSNDSKERPSLYHAKGSGDLEYDLDCAMVQAKDWEDTKELTAQLQQKAEEMGKDPTRIPKVDVVNIYLDKNRDAPEGIYSVIQYLFFIEDNKFIEMGPKFADDKYRFGKVEDLIKSLINQNYITFYDKPQNATYDKGRVKIRLKDI